MEVRNNKVYLGDISALDLAEQFGTPLYVIEEDTLRRQYRSLFAAIPYRPLSVFYACKANWNIQVMKIFHEEGAQLDVCSPGDVRLAFAAGYQPNEMLYTGYAVSDEELQTVLQHGIRLNIDSLSQMRRYAGLGGKGKIGLRVNTGVRAGFHAHVTSAVPSSKFGVRVDQLDEARALAAAHGLTVTGLHTHLGSDILQFEPFLDAMDVLLAAAEKFEELEYIDLGGGLGVPYGPLDRPVDLRRYGELLVERFMSRISQHGVHLALYLEPGEFLSAESTWLLTRVTDIKPGRRDETDGISTFVGTDASFNLVFAAAIYDAYHEIFVVDRAQEDRREVVHICGNLMQAGDVLAKARPMPLLCEGDLLAIANCGAYAMCRASRFNGRPLPAEVMVRAGRPRLVRRRETPEDLLAKQILG